MVSLVVQLKLLGLIILVLADIAVNVANVNHIVRFSSGINNNDTLRRLWSRPVSVIFFPVASPMLLSWVLAWGTHAIIRSILVGFLQIVDAVKSAHEMSLLSEFAVFLAASVSCAMVSMAIYAAFAGMSRYYQIAGTVTISLVVSIPRVMADHNDVSSGVLALWIIVTIFATAAMGWWTALVSRNRTATATVRELMPDRAKITPPQTGNPALIIVSCIALLILVRLWDELLIWYVHLRDYNNIYLAQVLRNFGGLMVLIGCSFLSIRMVNTWIGKRPMAWQWWSIMAPVLVLLVEECVIFVIKTLSHKPRDPGDSVPTSFLLRYVAPTLRYADRIVMYGTAGFLGCATYLAVLARAAMQALDPGIDGQNELILDEDDSEYEV